MKKIFYNEKINYKIYNKRFKITKMILKNYKKTCKYKDKC